MDIKTSGDFECIEGELHNFKPRYDEFKETNCFEEQIYRKTYLYDICIKCGSIILRDKNKNK